MLFEKFTDGAGDLPRGLQYDGSAIHFEGSIERQAKIFGKGTVGVEGAAEHAGFAFVWTDKTGTGSIAEKDRDAPFHGLAEDHAGHFLGTDDEDFAQAVAETRGERHGKKGSRAGQRNVNRGSAMKTEPMCDGGGGAGELTFSTTAGDEDHAERGGRELGFVETRLRGAESEIGDGLVIGGEAALVDATDVFDPFRIAADVSADFRIRDDPFGELGSEFTKEGHRTYFP